MQYIRARTAGIILMTAAMILTGCKKKQPVETEPPTEPKKVVLTEKETEPKAAKKVSSKDIQIAVPKANRAGSGTYSVEVSGEKKEGSLTFESSNDAVHFEDGSRQFYAGKTGSYADDGSGWREFDSDFDNIWTMFYSSTYDGTTQLNGNNCAKFVIETEDLSGIPAGLCEMSGLTETMTGTVDIAYYVTLKEPDIARIEIDAPFMAQSAAGADVKGNVSAILIPSSKMTASIAKPTVEKETETEQADEYTAGEINEETNIYLNRTFGTQVAGKELFVFDDYRTQEVESGYRAANSIYTEEGYGAGDGIIVNITSCSKGSGTRDTVLSKYLEDSKATDITSSGVVSIGSLSYVSADSMINDTSTRTYATEAEGRILLITVYYQDADILSKFTGCIFSTDEDPNWVSETWMLDGKYAITTPKGYSISRSKSQELYVCMTSASKEINVFSVRNTTVDEQASMESETANGITKELISEEDVSLDDGTMKYLLVSATEPSYGYYIYIGLKQANDDVIKFYAVSSRNDANFIDAFKDAANSLSYDKGETETSSEEGSAE